MHEAVEGFCESNFGDGAPNARDVVWGPGPKETDVYSREKMNDFRFVVRFAGDKRPSADICKQGLGHAIDDCDIDENLNQYK